MKGEPISRANVCDRIGELSKKAIGRKLNPHIFRHKKATYLYGLVKNNKISESTALALLGHGKSMMDTYDHTPKDEEIAILKEQAFNPEITEDERKNWQREMAELKKEQSQKMEIMQKKMDDMTVAVMDKLGLDMPHFNKVADKLTKDMEKQNGV